MEVMIMFCPKCGSILTPQKEGTKKVLACACGYKSGTENAPTLKEKSKQSQEIEVVDKNIETDPLTDAECPKCGHKKAFFYLVQTRASDEPETKFLRCEKCNSQWRDYS